MIRRESNPRNSAYEAEQETNILLCRNNKKPAFLRWHDLKI